MIISYESNVTMKKNSIILEKKKVEEETIKKLTGNILRVIDLRTLPLKQL